MKKLNKKGFTIVELVIVIAVIAILAAVLIPTFATVIQKANENAALQAARNAYTEIMAVTTADLGALLDSNANSWEVVNTATSNGLAGEVVKILKELKITKVTYTAGDSEKIEFVVGSYTVTNQLKSTDTDTTPLGWKTVPTT
ncbi:MAG: type II secretion system protein [Clostridia bacterium]|nr:type II secretion system protein [Clostridia bacterium]